MNDDWMEEMLEAQPDHLADGGFTDAVMEALPARRRRWRTLILLGSALLAAFVGFVLLPGGELLWQAVEEVVALQSADGELPLVSAVILGMVIWGAVAAARTES